MRDIKFRVYDTVNKCFIEDMTNFWITPDFKGLGGLQDGIGFIADDLQPDGPFVFQQFTGLKDKNGKDIYEGDILEIEFQNIDNERHMINAEVVYDGNGFYEKWEGFDASKVKTHHGLRRLRGSKNYEYNGKKFTLGSSEIIGNIFQGVDK